ncbi:GNAT family N-acetyltransferase [Pilimelia terevasa]|nr:GNAT family N-acetyltransferase [Pilimelia terevasa]
MVEVHQAGFAQLDPHTLYEVLRLRAEVFVVEQDCPYQDLDNRDVEPTALHVWSTGDGALLGYLRVLEEPDGTARIGRVVVRGAARGTGVVQRLMHAALAHIGARPSVLAAQAHLERFYARFGYRACGPGFDEDGIPHLPMRRDAD